MDKRQPAVRLLRVIHTIKCGFAFLGVKVLILQGQNTERTVREVCGKTQNTIRIHLSWEMDMRAAEAARIKRNVKILEGNLFNMAAVKRFINRIPEIKTLFKSRHSWPAGGKRFCMAVVLCLFIFIALDKRLTVGLTWSFPGMPRVFNRPELVVVDIVPA